MKNNKPKYTTILHNVRIELKLSVNEYCVADMIYHLSNNPESKINGWCYAGKQTIADILNISKATIHQIINRLIKIGLVVRDTETKYLKTTQVWYEAAIFEREKFRRSKETVLPVKSLRQSESRNDTQASKETIRNNNIDNNKEYRLIKEEIEKIVGKIRRSAKIN